MQAGSCWVAAFRRAAPTPARRLPPRLRCAPHPPAQVTKQPLLPPLLPVVQQGRGSAGHSRSGSRTQADLKGLGGGSSASIAHSRGNSSSTTTNLQAAAVAAAVEEQQQRLNGASGSGVRHPRPRSIAVMAGPPPEAFDREDSPTSREGLGGGSGAPPLPPKSRAT